MEYSALYSITISFIYVMVHIKWDKHVSHHFVFVLYNNIFSVKIILWLQIDFSAFYSVQ